MMEYLQKHREHFIAVSALAITTAVMSGIILLVVSSCSVPDWLKGPPKKGTVVAKRHEPARHYEEWDSCKTTVPVTRVRTSADGKNIETYTDFECHGGYVERFDDEDWKLRLEQCKENDDGTKGKCRRGWREVRHDAYDRIQVGEYYDGSDNV